jgi:hypothetical protein
MPVRATAVDGLRTKGMAQGNGAMGRAVTGVTWQAGRVGAAGGISGAASADVRPLGRSVDCPRSADVVAAGVWVRSQGLDRDGR